MKSKLNLNFAVVDKARQYAREIAADTQKFIEKHTSVTIERTVARLLGIDGVDTQGVPLPNILVDNIRNNNGLSLGLSAYVGNAMIQTGKTPQQVAEAVANGELDITRLKMADMFEIRARIEEIARQTVERIRNNRRQREEYLGRYGDKKGPYLYVIVATGNIYEDIIQAHAAANQCADIIAVIRTTGQSLLDFVPFG
ncbi:MAG TPA: lysine 5,6-aminomutase subunit alpha, partial [Candidatus Rifleibacterium sp.]|nr:lysine 5,6-aminomutase subunit alpha [Candidatus Rifleibacterium sp.]